MAGVIAMKFVRTLFRWMNDRHIEDVVAISGGDETKLDRATIDRCMRELHFSGIVIELCNTVGGYLIYEITEKSIVIHHFCIAKHLRRIGVGKEALDYMKQKAGDKTIRIEVGERNLNAQLFLRSQGFRHELTRHSECGDSYLLSWRLSDDGC